ncbi:MAG: arsenate reductase family protein [Gilvibacter sp.]
MITIYHNSRCRKSREAHQVLEESGKAFKVHFYLDNPLDKAKIKDLLSKIGIEPMALVRTTEAIWKEHFKGKDLSDQAIIEAMVQYPKLIERPILESDKTACVGRPIDNVHTFLREL